MRFEERPRTYHYNSFALLRSGSGTLKGIVSRLTRRCAACRGAGAGRYICLHRRSLEGKGSGAWGGEVFEEVLTLYACALWSLRWSK